MDVAIKVNDKLTVLTSDDVVAVAPGSAKTVRGVSLFSETTKSTVANITAYDARALADALRFAADAAERPVRQGRGTDHADADFGPTPPEGSS